MKIMNMGRAKEAEAEAREAEMREAEMREAKCERVCRSLAKYWTRAHCMRVCLERDEARTPAGSYYVRCVH